MAIKPSTGEILAMVGSADFYNEAIDGQVNMATSPTRQPGSSIKPINYVAAFEKGWTPATLIWDVPSEFPPSGDPNDPREPYKPVNYDEKVPRPGDRAHGAVELVQRSGCKNAGFRRHLRQSGHARKRRHGRHGRTAGHHQPDETGLRPVPDAWAAAMSA